MKTEVIIVPKDKCPLNVLAEMGEKTYDAGILFGNTAIHKLTRTADRVEELDFTSYLLSWNATKDFPKTTIVVVEEESSIDPYIGYHHRAILICANDIRFKHQLDNRTVDYFLTMEE